MTDAPPAACVATYSDAKFIKSRSVLQVVLEIPIERANEFFRFFGTPSPQAETWVAIARLNVGREQLAAGVADVTGKSESIDRAGHPVDRHPLARDAAIRCGDEFFQSYLERNYGLRMPGPMNKDKAAAIVRDLCGVKSRSQLDSEPQAADKWRAVVAMFGKYSNQRLMGKR